MTSTTTFLTLPTGVEVAFTFVVADTGNRLSFHLVDTHGVTITPETLIAQDAPTPSGGNPAISVEGFNAAATSDGGFVATLAERASFPGAAPDEILLSATYSPSGVLLGAFSDQFDLFPSTPPGQFNDLAVFGLGEDRHAVLYHDGENLFHLSLEPVQGAALNRLDLPGPPVQIERSSAELALGYANGDRVLVGGASHPDITGGAGNDTLVSLAAHDVVRGGDGNDLIFGGPGFDDINGNKGDDTILGGSGGGDDWLVGGQGNDFIVALNGGNILYGNLGDDKLFGGQDREILRGGQGDDTIFAGGGDDFVSGDRGDDTVNGGPGADIFHTFSGAGLDRVTDFNLAEGDRVQVDPGTTWTVTQVGADTVIDMGGGDRMVLVGVQMSTLTGNWIFVA